MIYEADKNFRCDELFSKYKEDNKVDRSCFIILFHNNSKHVLKEIKNEKDFLCGCDFPVTDMFMIGMYSNKFKVSQNSRFYINTNSFLSIDNINNTNIFIEKRITFDCIFRNISTQTDSMLL